MHVAFEGPGVIESWAREKNHRLEYTRLYEGDSLPELKEVDMLVIMGGPMNVFDFHLHPWMQDEIEWHNLQFLPALGEFRICKNLPATRKVLHWHGDSFPIPEGAIRIASSTAFPNQGFIYKSKAIALQFHLEVTPESVRGLVENCGDELVPGPHIQTEKQILGETGYYESNQQVMFQFLNYLSALIT